MRLRNTFSRFLEITAGLRGSDSTTILAMSAAAVGRRQLERILPHGHDAGGVVQQALQLVVQHSHLGALHCGARLEQHVGFLSSCPPMGSSTTMGSPRASASAVVSPPGLLSSSVAAPSRSGISLV